MKVKEIDRKYQEAVDALANKFVLLDTDDLASQPDYGSFTSSIDGKDVEIGFWHYRLAEDVEHLVFILTRKLLVPGFYRKFISGVVLGSKLPPRLMTDEEVGDYD